MLDVWWCIVLWSVHRWVLGNGGLLMLSLTLATWWLFSVH